MLPISRLLALLILSLAAPQLAQAQAQGERLDVGSFTIFAAGQRVGREQFSIRRIASQDGGVLECRAESAAGELRSAMRLETDSAGTPVRYTLEERTGAEVTRRLGGQRLRGRFATLARGVTGEAAREYVLSPGAIILEEDGLAQYALLLRGRQASLDVGQSIPTLTPTENRQGIVRLVLESQRDTVTIAGAKRAAWRWRAVPVSGDARTIWADAEGRVLRVYLAARGLDALRDDVPRDDVRREAARAPMSR
jgi:hypothetical protein